VIDDQTSTQPAVSRQIALLERHLNAQLLVRGRGGARPTPAGEVLLEHVAAVMDRLTLAESQVRALQNMPSGTVRLGSFFSALVQLSAEVATVVGEHYPYLHIRDDLVDRDTAYGKLSRSELDLAIVSTTISPQRRSPRLSVSNRSSTTPSASCCRQVTH
jgi:DNA-binding transcriptional LysR family regulator